MRSRDTLVSAQLRRQLFLQAEPGIAESCVLTYVSRRSGGGGVNDVKEVDSNEQGGGR
jgi:hypothetical protein